MDESNLTLDKSPQREITIKKQIKYLLYEPKEYTDKKACPLLIFLHGAGERGDDLELVKKHGPPKLIESGVDFPFFVASPQLPPDEWWSPSTVLWVLRDVQSRVNVDADRVYLTGLSMGGYGTWETAARYPHLFAAIAPICGRGDPCTADKISRIPIWIFHGAKDPIVPIKYSEAMYEALKPYGKTKFTIYPDAEHDSWTITYENQELYDWLMSHSRKEDSSN